MEIRHLKAACELSVIALERLANGDITNPQEYARDVLTRVRKWYPAEQSVERTFRKHWDSAGKRVLNSKVRGLA